MIDEKLRAALNEQIKYELESAYLYLGMAGYFQGQNFDGMAQWMRVQSMEEVTHAMKFFHHILERGGQVTLLPLGIKKTEWSSPLEAFSDAYDHEKWVTSKIHELSKLSRQVGDYPAEGLLQWFVNEQVEEEASTSKVAEELRRIGDNGAGLVMLDRELQARTFVMPPAGGAGPIAP